MKALRRSHTSLASSSSPSNKSPSSRPSMPSSSAWIHLRSVLLVVSSPSSSSSSSPVSADRSVSSHFFSFPFVSFLFLDNFFSSLSLPLNFLHPCMLNFSPPFSFILPFLNFFLAGIRILGCFSHDLSSLAIPYGYDSYENFLLLDS